MIEPITEFQNEFRFLSNFWPALGKTVEHFFQAEKTLDPQWKARILRAPTPSAAKVAGRAAPLRENWDEIKIPTMKGLLQKKFADKELALDLMLTDPRELIEGNWWHDNFWGNCLCARCNHIEGENHLGKLLMEVRDEIIRASTIRT